MPNARFPSGLTQGDGNLFIPVRRAVLRGERSRKTPDLPDGNMNLNFQSHSHRKELTYRDFQPPFVIPPAQIRTCAANASGSCFESDAQTLPFGAPCLNRSLILPASEFRTQEGKQNSSQPSPFAPQAPLISFALLLSTNDLIVRRFIATTNLSDFLKT